MPPESQQEHCLLLCVFPAQPAEHKSLRAASRTTAHTRIEYIPGQSPEFCSDRSTVVCRNRCFGCTQRCRRFCIRHPKPGPLPLMALCFRDPFDCHEQNARNSSAISLAVWSLQNCLNWSLLISKSIIFISVKM